MGLLSKIFNTDKLSYILRENDFEVDAPEGWNVIELGVGDVITPDMWKEDNFPNSKFTNTDREIVDIRDGTYVTLKPEDSDLITSTYIEIVNSKLKPDYQISKKSLTESEDDDFTVDAPEEWNVTTLTDGDFITPDMWKHDVFRSHFDINTKKPVKIKFNVNFIILTDALGYEDYFDVYNLNQLLKPEYQIVEPDDLNESDEFTVDAPKEWNERELKVGNVYNEHLGQVWDTIEDYKQNPQGSPLFTTYVIEYIGPNEKGGEYYNSSYYKSNIVGIRNLKNGKTWSFSDDYFNMEYGSKLNAYVPTNDLKESEDEWTVDAPEGWDTFPITIIMTNEYTFYRHWDEDHDQLEEVKVTETDSETLGEIIGQDIPYDAKAIEDLIESVFLENNNLVEFLNSGKVVQAIPDNFYRDGWDNEWEDYKIQVILPSKLNESDDDFTVDAPEEWNENGLEIGDTITPNMWKNTVYNNYYKTYNWTIESIVPAATYDNVIIRSDEGEERTASVDMFNTYYLKPEFPIIKPLTESDDEFTVVAPEEWNDIELTVGDEITPEMWNSDTSRGLWFVNHVDGNNENWKITKIGKEYEEDDDDRTWVYITGTNTGKKYSEQLNDFNDYLKPRYIVVEPINESEDEFTVDAPKEWNEKILELGDYINEYTDQVYYNEEDIPEEERYLTYKIDYIGPNDENNKYFDYHLYDNNIVTLKNVESGVWYTFSVKFFNQEYGSKLNAYVDYPEKGTLNEQDEFSVVAPDEWNVTELGVGDFITPEMYEPQFKSVGERRFRIKLVDPNADSVFLKDLSGNLYAHSLSRFNDYYLLPQYKIVKSLTESKDDEFNVVAPKEWGDEFWEPGAELHDKELFKSFSKFVYNNLKNHGVKRNDIKKYLEHILDIAWYDVEGYIGISGNKLFKDYEEIMSDDEYWDELDESDEFNVVAPPEWNIIELTELDIITPDMFRKSNRLSSQKWKILHVFGAADTVYIISLESKDLKKLNISSLEKLLKPEYKIVEEKDLFESDDEFSVEAPPEWDSFDGKLVVDFTLRVGYVYVNEDDEDEFERLNPGIRDRMSYDDEPIYVHEINQTEPFEIEMLQRYYDLPEFTPPLTKEHLLDWTGFDDEDLIYWIYELEIPVKEIKTYYTDVNFNLVRITDSMKQRWEYYDSANGDIDKIEFINNINESDDEFTVDAPEDWNVTELGPGDTIIGEMWDWGKIIRMENRRHGDDHEALNRDIERWKQIYDEGVTIKSIEDKTWVNFSGNLINWGPSIIFINNLLSPGYKIEQSLTESDDEFTVDAPQEWNQIELGVGDKITPDMWNIGTTSMNGFKFPDDFRDVDLNGAYTIETIEKSTVHGTPYIRIVNGEDEQGWDMNILNSVLKSHIQIIPPTEVNESDDEWTVDAPKDWDEFELTAGDDITLDMVTPGSGLYKLIKSTTDNRIHIDSFQDDLVVYVLNSPPNFVFPKPYKDIIKRGWQRMEQQGLKPNYKLVPPTYLNESDNDFTVDAPEEWDVTELTVGDEITPDMFSDGDFEFWVPEGTSFTISDYGNDGYKDYIKLDYKTKNGHKTSTLVYVHVMNDDVLEPKYKVVPPLNESDDFTVDAPEDWDKEYLKVGDVITPDMWNNINEFRFEKPVYIIDIGTDNEGDFVILSYKPHSDGFDPAWDLDEINYYLKHPYVIINDINENESDEWTVDAPKDWNIADLKVGDIITPDMWSYRGYIDASTDALIKDIGISDGIPYVTLEFSSGMADDWKLDTINNSLEPKYQVASPSNLQEQNDFTVTAPEEWDVTEYTTGDTFNIGDNVYVITDFDIDGRHVGVKKKGTSKEIIFPISLVQSKLPKNSVLVKPTKLSELLETDDEWSVDAPIGWNETQLTVDDEITPDMWDEKAVIDAGEEDEFLNNEIWTILKIDGEYITISSDGGGFLDWIIQDVQSLLKPQYKIVSPDNLNESDEFIVDVPEGWNVKELTVGDRITPDMLKNPDRHDYKLNHFLYNPEYRVEIKKVDVDQFGEYVVLYITTPEDIVREKRDLDALNDLLKPDYQVTSPNNLNESDDDFTVDAPKEWNVTELGLGDIITPDMWNKNLPREYGQIETWIDNPKENQIIDYIEFDDYNKLIVVFSGQESDISNGHTLDTLNILLDPKYQVVSPDE